MKEDLFLKKITWKFKVNLAAYMMTNIVLLDDDDDTQEVPGGGERG